ncbi:MAG: heterodisulfide reductase-related iron-sulfur binding cluster [candidate division Zixibacteria bacterium]|nr:heterodisulfide reductase-related iron-sulfur binding cluster [candidate division Zixibacteria bacterium]
MEITREIFWNVGAGIRIIIYILAIIPLVFLIWGIYKKIRLWRIGKPENRYDKIGKRILSFISFGLFHKRFFRDLYPGLMHLFIFWGFVVLFLGTAVVMFQDDIASPLFGIFFFHSYFYLYFSLILDIFGLLLIIGIVMALFRRYILRPKRLDNILDDVVVLILLLAIATGGFLNEALRISATKPQFEVWSFVGWNLSKLFWNLNPNSIRTLHLISWWTHLALALFFIGYIAYSKLLHILSSSLNIFFRSFEPKGRIPAILDIENQETFGVDRVEQFNWKQLLDTDACTRCGRCQDNCPAYLSQKPLSPKKVNQDIKTNFRIRAEELLGKDKKDNPSLALIGDSVKEDEIWSCTTCYACHQACPVLIEHIDKIVDMRRHLVLMQSRFPNELKNLFKNMETNYNPWAFGYQSRADWAKDLGIKIAREDTNFDILYWVGCSGSFDDRNKKVSRALVKILKQAKVNFAILGNEEMCCGETARRIGNEYLAQILMQGNIEILKKYGVRRILVTCPHGYNTFKNEYREFGGNFEVIHHTEFIWNLIKDNKIKLKSTNEKSITYHDSCYLGRYNDIYDAPREIIKKTNQGKLNEVKLSKSKSFCCGAGGGRMWMEENLGKRINQIRIEQLNSTGSEVISTACPYCLTMLEDGVKEKALEEKLRVKDIAELVEELI